MAELLVFRDNWDKSAPQWLQEKRLEAEARIAKLEDAKDRLVAERASSQHGHFDSRGRWTVFDQSARLRSWSSASLKMSGVIDRLGMPVGIFTEPKSYGGTLVVCFKKAVAEMLRQQAAAVELCVKRPVVVRPGAEEPEKPRPWPKSALAVASGYEKEAVQEPASEDLQSGFDALLADARKHGPGSQQWLSVEKRLSGDATALWTMRCPKGYVHVRVDRMLLATEVVVPWLDAAGCERLTQILREGGGMALSSGNYDFDDAVRVEDVPQLSDVPALTGTTSAARSFAETTARAPYQLWPGDTDRLQEEKNQIRKDYLQERVTWGWV